MLRLLWFSMVLPRVRLCASAHTLGGSLIAGAGSGETSAAWAHGRNARFRPRQGALDMTADVATRAGPGADEAVPAASRAAAPQEAASRTAASQSAASQAALDALLCELLPRQGCWSDEGARSPDLVAS